MHKCDWADHMVLAAWPTEHCNIKHDFCSSQLCSASVVTRCRPVRKAEQHNRDSAGSIVSRAALHHTA